MKINELTTRADLVLNSKVAKAHQQFEKLLSTIIKEISLCQLSNESMK